jgi:hypothetical protein
MGVRNQVGMGLWYWPARARIFKLLRSLGIDSKESIPPACSLAGWYDTAIPARFLTPIDCLIIPAQATQPGGINSSEPILGLLKSLKIRVGFWTNIFGN